MKYVSSVRVSLVLAAAVCLSAAVQDASAATMNWDSGAGDNLWVSPTNWSGHLVPTASDDARIDTITAYAKIRPGDAAVGRQIIVGRNAAGPKLEMTGGTLTWNAGGYPGIYIGQYLGSSGLINLSGGVITCDSEFVVGYSGAGTLNMTGGTINVSTIGFYISRNTGASGRVSLGGGVVNCNALTIGAGGVMNISNSGVLVIDGDKTATIAGYITAGKLTACSGAGTVLYDYNMTNSGKTTVWTACTVETSPGVSDPSPANAAVEMLLDAQLSWTAGSVSAASFRVYFGTSSTAVFTATPASPEYKGTVTSPAFDPGALVKGSMYYWRIDELNSGGQVISTGPFWSFRATAFDPTALGPIVVTPDWTGVRSIPAAPAIGQHPRIYFSSADKATILNRWNTTVSGAEAKAQLYAYVRLMELGYTAYNALSATPVRQDAYGHNRISNVGYADAKTYYDRLVAGTANPLSGADSTKIGVLRANMAVMALHYYITDNTTGLQNIAKAAVSWVANTTEGANVHIAYCYDFAYNVMNTSQRDTLRKAIYDYLAFGAAYHPIPPYGTYTEAYATTGNWASLNSFQFLTCMAIEGETSAGVDPAYIETFKSWSRRAEHNFLTYGFYPSGIGWEGQGKDYVWATALVPWAMRGESFVAHPRIHAYAQDYLPAMMQPYGFAFQGYDAWGGTGNDPVTGGYKFNGHDAVGLKWIFPTDTKVDFLWRNYMQYMDHPGSYNYVQFAPAGYDNSLVAAAIFTSDYSTAAWDQSILPTTSFLSDEGLMITRSDNATTAMGMQFHCRQNFGGHTHGDRNNFNLSALGRVWGVYRTSDHGGTVDTSQMTKYKSCLLIDVDPADPCGNGYGIPITWQDGNKSRQPGKMVDFFDGDKATFASGDATYAYSWEWCWVPAAADAPDDVKLSQGWTKSMETFNDFRPLNPGTEFYWDLPFYEYAHWNEYPKNERILKRPSGRPMSYVYRSAGIVRGSGGNKPYALVIDDAKVADGLNHSFWWQMQLPYYGYDSGVTTLEELTIESTNASLKQVILKERVGNRRLLVRVLQNDGYTGTPAFVFTRLDPDVTGKYWPVLIVESTNCLDPRTKILLYPHYSGDALPTTDWDGSNLTVTIGSQTDTFKFNVGTDNRTRFTMYRNGCPFVPNDGDLTRDGNVDFTDYAALAQTWPLCQSFVDLATIAAHWLQ